MNVDNCCNTAEPKCDPEITRQIAELNDVIFKTLDRLGTMTDKMGLLGTLPPTDNTDDAPAPDPTTVVQKLDAILHRARIVNERVDYFNNFLGDLV